MKLFDKKFVHCVWDDSLKGKSVFCANSLPYLQDKVNLGNLDMRFEVFENIKDGDYPFEVADGALRYVYYDPNYENKIAHLGGKTIQVFVDATQEWEDIPDPSWDEHCLYRIKPGPKWRMTYLQLAEWIAKGNGMYRKEYPGGSTYATIDMQLDLDNGNTEVDKEIKICHWDSTEWIEPTLEVYREDCI